MARAVHRLNVVVHEVVPPVGPVEAKKSFGTGESETFHGHMERKRAEQNGQKSDRSEQSEANGSFSLRWGVQKVVF